MLCRRQFTQLSAAAMASSVVASSCSTDNNNYGDAVSQIWRHTNISPANEMTLQRELVRYATLAASGHNTQCWKFQLEDRLISILPDLERRTPVVDPDDHHLYASLGCATENLVQAAKANGLESTVDLGAGESIKIHLEPTQAVSSPLFEAIPNRQSTRTDYNGQPLSNEELKQLEQTATGTGVNLILLTDQQAMEQVLAFVIEGNTLQINDPAFVKELKTWVRFNEKEAVRKGDGLFTKSSGNPTLPHWLGNRLFGMLLSAKSENEKYTHQLRSSAGIAIFVSDQETQAHWIEAGRCYQRFALQAEALDIRTAFLNQPVEVASLRPQFATSLGISAYRPDLVVRFGRGPKMPRSLRRPVGAVIV
ncbi:nitroreductase family oxidoreductase [Leptolyngbya sp. PCC 7375]|nr:nitroreductase family oxidoreductase [Leptolyngbya sp. PCC 7375]